MNEGGSWWERIVEGFLQKILEPFEQLKTVDELVFGVSQADVWGLFSRMEYEQVILPGQNLVFVIAWSVLIVAVIFASQQLSLSGINPGARQNLMHMTGNWLFVAFLLGHTDILLDVMFRINQAIVMLFQAESSGSFSELSFANPETGVEMNMIAQMLIKLVVFGLSIWLNFFYIMRKYLLIFLIILAPIFIALYLFPTLRGVTSAWLKEVFSNIIAQSVHAMMLWVFLSMGDVMTGNWLVYIVVLCLFIPFSETVRMLLGASGGTGNLAAAGTMLGMGSLLHLGRTVQEGRRTVGNLSALRQGSSGIRPEVRSSSVQPPSTILSNGGMNSSRFSTGRRMASELGGGLTKMAGGSMASIVGAAALGKQGMEAGEQAGWMLGDAVGRGVGTTLYVGGAAAVRRKPKSQLHSQSPSREHITRSEYASRKRSTDHHRPRVRQARNRRGVRRVR